MTLLKVHIRTAFWSDAFSIASVLFEAFVEYRSSYTPEAFEATAPSSNAIQKRMQEGPLWVAVREGAILGTVAAISSGGDLYIRGMAVLPSARGRQSVNCCLNTSGSMHSHTATSASRSARLHSWIVPSNCMRVADCGESRRVLMSCLERHFLRWKRCCIEQAP